MLSEARLKFWRLALISAYSLWQMKFVLCFLLLSAVVYCGSAVQADLRNHVAAANVAFVRFSRDQIFGTDMPDNASVICQAIHIPHAKEHSISDMHFKCFSTMESSGFNVEVESISCAMDESPNAYVDVSNPIRDNSCRLVPRLVPLSLDYEKELDAFKKQQVWFCAESSCAGLDITFYDIVAHRVADYFAGVSNALNIKCDQQICFFERHATIEFYKKLFYLLWNK